MKMVLRGFCHFGLKSSMVSSSMIFKGSTETLKLIFVLLSANNTKGKVTKKLFDTKV